MELTSHMLGHIIVLGPVDFVSVYSQHVKNVEHVPETRAELHRALGDNKQLGEQLSHVQGRCTEYAMENRALKRRPGERFVGSCGECPCAYYTDVDGDVLKCGLSNDTELDCIPIGDPPKDCPLKHNPTTLRVKDG